METIKKQLHKSRRKYFINSDLLFVKKGSTFHRLELKDILYIKSMGKKSVITTYNNTIPINSSLKDVVERLKVFGFCKCHKNYLVQTSKIEIVDAIKHELIIGEDIVPIGSDYKKQFMKQLKKLK